MELQVELTVLSLFGTSGDCESVNRFPISRCEEQVRKPSLSQPFLHIEADGTSGWAGDVGGCVRDRDEYSLTI